ncbi:AlpA family phage regulatory protein [Achromobacter sp. Marseille-Q4962]|uniref:helix-turn-helix transcriptional regulator n=1 Tax=Achromobacter sp. Marseille-Q4962 TaxID=2942202 RepID=UPI00336532DD
MSDTEKILVTATEAASMLSIGRSTFFRKVASGYLPKPVKIGGATRWRLDDLRAVGRANRPTIASAADAAAGTEPGCTQP